MNPFALSLSKCSWLERLIWHDAYEDPVMPAEAGIQRWRGVTRWTPAFAGVTR